MHQAELSERNYRRISWINTVLTPPLFVLFAWPYMFFGLWFEFPEVLLYPGIFCFSLPFTLTILHGHVTIALGALHRDHYHEWLTKHSRSYGFLIRPVFFSTRFRLTLLLLSLAILLAGILLYA